MSTWLRRLGGRLTRWLAPDVAASVTAVPALRRRIVAQEKRVGAVEKRLGAQAEQRSRDARKVADLARQLARRNAEVAALRADLSLLRQRLQAAAPDAVPEPVRGFALVEQQGITVYGPPGDPGQLSGQGGDNDADATPDISAQALDVELGGRRIWSMLPSRDGRPTADGGTLVRWPPQLRSHLDGAAEVVVRPSSGGSALFEGAVSFGSGRGTVDLRDALGRPLTVDKDNRVTPMFAQADPAIKQELVRVTEEAVRFLIDQGYPAFFAFGNLLGAVRDGRLIGHDNDADIAYVARATDPVDIMLESLELERVCRRQGWATRRMSGGCFKLMYTRSDGGVIGIDVFTAFYLGGRLWVMPSVVADLPPKSLLPPTEVTLEGQPVTAPADPEALLEATYGPGWRTPDPSFKYAPPLHVRQTLNGFMRGERRHLRRWLELYDGAKCPPTQQSPFAEWVAGAGPLPRSLVDVGCGNGRDALWFAGQGVSVVGCDYAATALAKAEAAAAQEGSGATFRRANLYDLRSVLTTPALLGRDHAPDAVYARFLVHALEDDGRINLWRFSRSLLQGSGGRLFLEFRTKPSGYVFGKHFRNLVPAATVTAELGAYGFTVEHLEEGTGLAALEREDPQVCRIIARLERRP